VHSISTDNGHRDRVDRRTELGSNIVLCSALKTGTAQRHAQSLQPSEKSVAGSGVVVSASLKLLGVTFDRTRSFNKHVSSVDRTRMKLPYVWLTALPVTCL